MQPAQEQLRRPRRGDGRRSHRRRQVARAFECPCQLQMDFRRCLALQTPYLGSVIGAYTDWTPLTGRGQLFAETLDRRNPWAFANIIVR